MARKSLSELREEMREVAGGERKLHPFPRLPCSLLYRARPSNFWPFCCASARRA